MKTPPNPTAPVVPQARPDLSGLWPEIERRLRRALGAGLDRNTEDDIVQEVAVRLLESRLGHMTPDELLPWCITTAKNLQRSAIRKEQRRARISARYPTPEPIVDVSEIAEARLAAENVMASLSPADRSVVAEALTGPADRSGRERSQQYLRVFRARRRIAELGGGAFGWVLAWLHGARARLSRVQLQPEMAVQVTVVAAIAVAELYVWAAPPPAEPAATSPAYVNVSGAAIHELAPTNAALASPADLANRGAAGRTGRPDRPSTNGARAGQGGPDIHLRHRVDVGVEEPAARGEIRPSDETDSLVCLRRTPAGTHCFGRADVLIAPENSLP